MLPQCSASLLRTWEWRGMFEKHSRHELSHGFLVIYAVEGRARTGHAERLPDKQARTWHGAREQDLKSETSFRIRIAFGVLKPAATSQNVRVVGQNRPGHAWQLVPPN